MSGLASKLLRRILAARHSQATNADWLVLVRQWNRLTAREKAGWRRTPMARRGA